MGFIFIDEREHELRKHEIRLTPQEVSELLEYSDVVKKWLKKNINVVQSQLALCQLQGKESEAYISINTIKKLLEDLDNTEKLYREFMNKDK